MECEWSVYPQNVRRSLRRPSWPKSAQVTTREVHANAPWGGDEELALGEGGAEGITWKTVPGSEAWNMHGI